MSVSQNEVPESPTEKVEFYLPRIFSVKGRIGRIRYLAYSLVGTLLLIPAVVFATVFPDNIAALYLILSYAAAVSFHILLSKRRFNDMNQSGWFSIVLIIPLINLIALIWLILGRGTESENRFGKKPCKNTTSVKVFAAIFPVLFIGGMLAGIVVPQYSAYVERVAQIQHYSEVENNTLAVAPVVENRLLGKVGEHGLVCLSPALISSTLDLLSANNMSGFQAAVSGDSCMMIQAGHELSFNSGLAVVTVTEGSNGVRSDMIRFDSPSGTEFWALASNVTLEPGIEPSRLDAISVGEPLAAAAMEGDFVSRYGDNIATQMESSYHPSCTYLAESIRTIANSSSPEYIRQRQIDTMIDKAPEACFY